MSAQSNGGIRSDTWQATDSEADVPSAGWREVYHWCGVNSGGQ